LVIGVVILMLIFSVNAQYQQTLNQQSELSESVAVQTANYLAKLRGDLQTLASIVPQSPQSTAGLSRLLYSAAQNNPAMMELAVIGPDGRDQVHIARADVPDAGSVDRSDSEAFKAAQAGRAYVSRVSIPDKYPEMSMSVPIITEAGPVGAVWARLDLTPLWDIVADVELGQRGYAYVVDDQGLPVAYRDWAAIQPEEVKDVEVVREAVTVQTESATSRSYANGLIGQEQTLAFYQPIPVGPFTWYAIAEQPTSDAFAQVYGVLAAGIGLMLAAVASVLVTGWYLNRRVDRPLAILRQGASRLALGQFDARITGVKTGDELELIANEFNDMAAKLLVAQTSTVEAVREREEQYQTAQRRVREMSQLLKSGRAITSLDLESVLDNLARESAGTAGADRCAIFVLNETQRMWQLRGWWDFESLPKPDLSYELNEGVVGWTARERKSLFLANAQSDQRFVIKWDHDRDVAAVMNLPLLDEGRAIGVLQVSTRPGTPAFTREEQRLLASFAEQAAVAIKNAQLYEVERRRAQEMTLVAEINRTISQSLDLDATLNAILVSVREIIPYDFGEINLWSEEEKVLRTRGRVGAMPGSDSATLPGGIYRLDQGISGWLARQRQPLLITDLEKSEVQSVLDSSQFAARSLCAAPLLVGDRLVGTIELAALPPETFTGGHLETLQTVAQQASVAIQNAQLFAETRRRFDESATLARISTIAASALPPDELLRRLMTEVGKLVSAELGLAMIYNEDAGVLEPLLAASFGEIPESARDFRIESSVTNFDLSVFRTRQTFQSDDALNDPRVAEFYRPFVSRYQVRALLAGPLIVRDRGVGEVYVARRTVTSFTETDLQRLSTVLTLLAEAIENSRLSAEQQRRINQLNSLSEIGRSISAALDEAQLLDALYQQLNRVMDARSMHVVSYDETQDTVTFLRAYEEGRRLDVASRQQGGNTLTFHVCRQRRPLLLRGDVVARAAELGVQARVTAGTQSGAQAWMGVPMISGDDVLGMIAVQHPTDPYIYDQNDLNLLQSIANQAGVAMVNAHLYAETQRRLTQLSQLSESGRAISAALHEDDVLDVLYSQINRMMNARSMFVAYYDEPEDEITFRRIYEEGQLFESGDKRRGLNTVTFYVCRQRQSLLLHGDIEAQAQQMGIEVKTVGTTRQAKCWMGAPMIVGERVLGMLAVQDMSDERAYDENDLNLLQAIANQTGVALANARLYQLTDVQLSERVEELTALSAISQELNSTLEPERIFAVVLSEALKVTGADFGFISMTDAETEHLIVRATQGLTEEEIERLSASPIDMGEGITGQVALRGEMVLINDIRQSSDYRELRPGVQAEIAMPIRYAQSVVGVLNLESHRLQAFTEEHVNFLSALAAQAAIAIGNAQRLEEYRQRGDLLRRRAEQLTNLFQIGQAFRTDQPLELVLDEVVHSIQETVGFNIVVLSLLQSDTMRLRRVAAAGIPVAAFEEMKQVQQPWAKLEALIQDRFRISQSYYVPMEQREFTADLDAYMSPASDRSLLRTPGMWHGDDVLFVPLRGSGNKFLGIISVDDPLGGRIPVRMTIETLELFANQAAIAVENAYLFDDLQQRLNDLTLFNEVSRSISAKLDLDSLLTTVLNAAGELVGTDHATIFLRDSGTGKYGPRQAIGYNLADIRHLQFGPDEGLVGYMLSQEHAIIVPDVEENPHFVRGVADELMKSMILVPLSVGGQIIGVLTADKPVVNGFTNTDLVVLSTLADQAAVAIDNARLFEAEREQRSLSETLRDLTTVMSRTLNFDDLLDQMLSQVSRIVPHDAANIMMLEESGRQVRVVRSHGYDRVEAGLSRAIMDLRFSVRDTVNFNHIMQTGRPLLISDTRTFAGWIETPETTWVRACLQAPLRFRSEVVGFFNLDSATPGFFTTAHAERLMAFTAQAAISIENARLYEETRRRLQDQSLLYEAGQAISATLEVDQVLETISRQVVRATGAQMVLIQQWERSTDTIRTVFQRIDPTEGLHDLDLLEKPFAPTDYLKVAQFLRDRRSIALRLNDDELDPLLRVRMQDTGLLWIVEVPLVSRDEVLGLVRLGDTRFDRVLSDSEVQVIETIINQGAVALSNARLYDQVFKFTQELEARVAERTRELARANEELKLERDQVETLFRIASELSTSLDLDRVLNRALELVVLATGAVHGSILLVDPQTDVLVARAVLGGDRIPSLGKPTPFRRGEGLAGWAIVSRQSVIVGDVHSDPRWIEHHERVRPYHSALVSPLAVSEDVLGAMLLLHEDAHYFNETHLRLVTAASSQVATAINNAELYRYIREQAELLGGMLRAQQIEGSKSQAILESVTDGVMVTDNSGRITLFNVAAERILGVKRDEVIGRSIGDMMGLYASGGSRWVQQVHEWHSSAAVRRQAPVLSQRIEFKAEKRYITVTVAPVIMTDEYLGSVSVFRDITAEVEADRAKTEFISTVSHELRTPMTSIKGYADLLLIGAAGAVNENQQRFLSVIKSNADRLSVLVNDLLDISRIESGRVKLELRSVAVESLLDTVIGSLHSRIVEKKQTVRIDLGEGDLSRVLADRDRIVQVLTNLVSNAHQYTPPGGTITISAREVGEWVQINVSDTGIGISPENQAKVFNRFFRVDDPNIHDAPGTGLGLAITKSLVEMHEGRIWLKSETGAGTTFSFTLRAAPEEKPAAEPPLPTVAVTTPEPAEPVEQERRQTGPLEPISGDQHVLVVEDDKDIAELIGRHLVASGYQVTIAGRAKEAIEKAHANPPSLITLDIYLPDADGFELLQQLKNDPVTAGIPVVIVSVIGDQREGLRLGAVDYLTKPIEPTRLVSAVNRVLQGPGKVLVVDDDHDTRNLLQVALEQRGFSVVLTSSGKRALTLARQEQPNLILLDLKLPGMDGYEVLQRLKGMPETADIPVVIITGSLTNEELKNQKLLSLGAARFMTKPFAVDELVYEIGVLVTNRSLVEPVGK
jgi:PAS domain S-box-containing protein